MSFEARVKAAMLDFISNAGGDDQSPIVDAAAEQFAEVLRDALGLDGATDGKVLAYDDTDDDVEWSDSDGGVPTGALMPFGGASAPSGYLLADGASYSTTTHAALFAVIGYTYGGAGSSFNVPDLRGRFALGKAASGTGSALGATGGSLDHDHGGATGNHDHGGATGSHDHTGFTGFHSHSMSGPNFTANRASGTLAVANTTHTHVVENSRATISNDTAPINNDTAPISADNPPYLALNWIIKT